MKKILIAITLTLTGCFPSMHQIEARCMRQFDPDTKPELYMNCVNSNAADVAARRNAFSQSMQNVSNSFKNNTTNCTTTCNYGTCNTTCR
jgi:hypothetical protein